MGFLIQEQRCQRRPKAKQFSPGAKFLDGPRHSSGLTQARVAGRSAPTVTPRKSRGLHRETPALYHPFDPTL